MQRIVILSGAGLSAESGLGTFRDKGGLWSEYDLNEVATPEGFARNPGLVHSFYNARRANLLAANPNEAHRALTRLESSSLHDVQIVTQNIDDLHERGGSRAVLHMHGELRQALCAACGHRWEAPAEMSVATRCPNCDRAAARPDVVWFGEYPYHLEAIAEAIMGCDLFVAIGTSGQVYPAAAFVHDAAEAGALTLELNLAASDIAHAFHETRQGPATSLVPAWVDELLA